MTPQVLTLCILINFILCQYDVFLKYQTLINVFFSTGNTALTGANLLFEMLCVLPKVKYY